MKSDERNGKSCEEIFILLNELVDGEIDPERKREAEFLIQRNPECHTLYRTLLKTVELYQQRRREIPDHLSPAIDWEKLEKLSD